MNLDQLGTERAALVHGQYATRAVLESRVSIYDYLVQPDSSAPGSSAFPAWVVDHVTWSGSETVLDVGCGPGAYFETLRGRANRVIGVDLSPGMLASIVEQRRGGTGLVAADAQALPIAANSAEVVICAHMLYHVPDIAVAVEDIRRVLRPGGYLLATANGAWDKAEIRDVWTAAALEVLHRPFRPPSWGERFNVDNAPDMLKPFLDVVTVDRSEGQFVLPDASPALTWINSLRAGTERELTDEQWRTILDETETRINDEVARHGSFRVTKSSGVVVARKAS